MDQQLRAISFVCTLKPSGEDSSTELLANQLDEAMRPHGIETQIIRAVDFTIAPGVEKDMGDGDDWPMLYQKILNADIVIIATPTWVGQMSSVALRIIERLDAVLSEKDEHARLPTFGKVAAIAVVGNEDGAHKISADLFQGLNDVGFTIPAQAVTYWNGEAMGKIDYKDLKEVPEAVASTHRLVASTVAHMAKTLKQMPYPEVE
jgi:multimeric flavodoxin WrbA